jgi:hypothetical protein
MRAAYARLVSAAALFDKTLSYYKILGVDVSD